MVLFKGELFILVEVECKPNQSCPNLGLHLLEAHLGTGISHRSPNGISQPDTHHPICIQVGQFHQCHQFKVWHCASHVPVTVLCILFTLVWSYSNSVKEALEKIYFTKNLPENSHGFVTKSLSTEHAKIVCLPEDNHHLFSSDNVVSICINWAPMQRKCHLLKGDHLKLVF